MLARPSRQRRIVPKATRRGRRNWPRNLYHNHRLMKSPLQRAAVARDPDTARLREAPAVVATRTAIAPPRCGPPPQAHDDAPRSRPPHAAQKHAQKPSVDPVLVQQFGGVEGHWGLFYSKCVPPRHTATSIADGC
ncbi:hypothetical protein NUW54_g4392 [Trametes sanguinea]|uniref:Uncharacterized protein n=1 Tax=Trametes sanguinea TaxID=158606 RepID=A0ACC1PY24_9APHY|nr:hypothetical protein NUW54_g4392 [Trametes sanguinea]